MRALALIATLAALTLSACSSKPRIFAPDEAVQAARFVADPPAEIRLYTSVSKRSGEGVHSGLLITGSQRVLFDPAGNWEHSQVPERHDVKYGMNDAALASYMRFQADDKHDLIVQRMVVPQSVADNLIARAELAGPVADALCASTVTSLLQKTPGFEGLRGSMFPVALSKGFRAMPGVTETKIIGIPFGQAQAAAMAGAAAAAPVELTN